MPKRKRGQPRMWGRCGGEERTHTVSGMHAYVHTPTTGKSNVCAKSRDAAEDSDVVLRHGTHWHIFHSFQAHGHLPFLLGDVVGI